MSKHPCSVVIPVYNSQETLKLLVERLGAALPQCCDDFEVILVNDGSRDASWAVICELAQAYPFVRGINMMRNYGQHNALLCGLRAARCPVTVTMDDDLQHPPEEIHHLLDKLAEGYDVVYGAPVKLPHEWWRNFTSWLTKRTLARVMGIPRIRDISAFRAFRTDLRRAFENYRSPHVILDALLSWGTANFTVMPIEEAPRLMGQSNYTFLKLLTVAGYVLTGFSTAPLRIASLTGFAVMLFGFAVFVYVLAAYFTAGSIPGFPFLASIISLFSGTQLFGLGIIGEYLAHIFERSMDRPTYVIGEQRGGE